jgi:hypothetical protein
MIDGETDEFLPEKSILILYSTHVKVLKRKSRSSGLMFPSGPIFSRTWIEKYVAFLSDSVIA